MRLRGSRGVRHLALVALFVAMAIICGYIEMLIPFSFGIPGVKLGLSNFVTVVFLYLAKQNEKHAIRLFDCFLIVVVRVLVVSLLFSNLYTLLYSISGGIISLLIMFFVSCSDRVSPTGCSVLGGITHNAAQLLIAVFIVKQLKIALYLPVLLFAGTITGFLIGIIANIIINRRGVRDYYDRFFEG